MSLSPFDHPLLSGLFADPELAGLFSAESDIAAMMDFEVALAAAQAEHDLIPARAADQIAALGENFVLDMGALRDGLGRDGVVAPDFVRQVRAALDADTAKNFHFAATSQDVIDTSLVIRLASVCSILDARTQDCIAVLAELGERYGDRRIMGRTRMQDALEISARERIHDWRAPLERHRIRLAELRPRLLMLQLGGAVGDNAKLGPRASAISASAARRLGLGHGEKSWHNQRDSIVEFSSWLALVAGSLGKIGQDVALMSQNRLGEIVLAGGGGSSAMPHKSNPVAAEVLVALARYCAGGAGTMGQSMVHEQERSGAAWTLEWLVLPQLTMATGRALLLAQRLLGSIRAMGTQD